MMMKPTSYPPYLTSRLRWLMLSRVMIVSFLLMIATFIQIKQMESLSAISASFLFKTVILTYLLSILYLFLLKSIPKITVNIYTQAVIDLALITAVIYATGGIHSIYSVFYPLVIIYSVLFLGRKGGLIIASVAGIMYGLFADLEFYGVIYPLVSIPSPNVPHNVGYVFTRIITHILSFYFIAFLASFVVEQERKARRLLDEKQTAFEQLDLLHRSIIESIDTGILTVNLDRRIKSFNRAAAEITGLSFREVVNRRFSDVFPDGPSLDEDRSANGNAWIGKTRFEIPFSVGGQTLILGGSVSPLRDQTGQTIGNIVIFQDLTEINVMRETIEKNRRLAYAGEMAAYLAHEIRNPLASISGSLQMLKDEAVLNDTGKRLLQIIFRGKDQLENFLKDFLLMPGLRRASKSRCVSTICSRRCSTRCVAPKTGKRDRCRRRCFSPQGPSSSKQTKPRCDRYFGICCSMQYRRCPKGDA